MNTEKMGAFIREKRKKKQLSQKQLADMVQVSTATVCKWEKGVNSPDIGNMEKLAEIFQVSIQEILAGEESAEVCPGAAEPMPCPELSGSPPDDPIPIEHSPPATGKRYWKIGAAAFFTILMVISAVIIFNYHMSPPTFSVIGEFYPNSDDLGIYAEFYDAEEAFCIVVNYSGSAKTDDFQRYNSILYDEYHDYFNEVKIIIVAYFREYNSEKDVIDSGSYQSFLFDRNMYN